MDLNLADGSPRTLHVLVIGGAVTDAAVIHRYLDPTDEERFELQAVGSMAEGVAELRGGVPDCVLLDLCLPDVSGLDALSVLRRHASGVPVIVLTGDDTDEEGLEALHASAQDYLVKSDLTASILRRSIRQAITRQRQQRLLHVARDVLAQEVAVREQAESALQRAAAELKRSNADLAEFAFVAAHDLRSPLGIISGYTQLLADLPTVTADPEAVDLIEHIHAGVARMQELIDDLLSFCSIGTGPVERLPVDLSVLAAKVCVPVVQRAAAGAAVDLGELPTVMGDEGQLSQLLDNLATNAAKFVPPDRTPRVSIWAEPDGDGWTITVADNGIGIPEQLRDQAFGMFQRVHEAGGFPGTGIGLAICHRVVEQHGGRIWIEDNVPVGTRVRVWLPAT